MIMFFPLHLSLPILKQQNQFPSSWFQLLLFSVFLYLPFVFYFFFYPLSRVNFLLYFSFSISPHPVISPSNRKIQSHFRQHASPSSLTSPRWLTSLSGWFPAGRGGRGEGAIFYLMFEYDFLFDFLFEIVFSYTRLWWNGSECPSLASSSKSQLLSRLLSKSFPCPPKSKKKSYGPKIVILIKNFPRRISFTYMPPIIHIWRGVRSYAQCGCNVLAKFWRLVGCSKRLDW